MTFNVSHKGFTEDWSALKPDRPKFKDMFKGTFVNLGTFQLVTSSHLVYWLHSGTEIPSDKFMFKMCTHDDVNTTFMHPDNCLLPLCSMITEEHMCHPVMLNHNNEPNLLVTQTKQ